MSRAELRLGEARRGEANPIASCWTDRAGRRGAGATTVRFGACASMVDVWPAVILVRFELGARAGLSASPARTRCRYLWGTFLVQRR